MRLTVLLVAGLLAATAASARTPQVRAPSVTAAPPTFDLPQSRFSRAGPGTPFVALERLENNALFQALSAAREMTASAANDEERALARETLALVVAVRALADRRAALRRSLAQGGQPEGQRRQYELEMQETQMSFNLQYLQLQSQMQHENRSYTAISNIMKTKHDTVKNSVSNIR